MHKRKDNLREQKSRSMIKELHWYQMFFLGYLVDPASGICLSQRLSHASACMSVYTTKLRMAR